jgi:hypothetical protein
MTRFSIPVASAVRKPMPTRPDCLLQGRPLLGIAAFCDYWPA